MRVAAILLLCHFLLVLLAPGIVVGDFLLERRHIERDLCVQRMVPEAVRTCHGQCYVMRQLAKVDQREKDMSVELRAFHLDDMDRADRPITLVGTSDHALPMHPEGTEGLLVGHRFLQDPVPWA
ncbi:MAG: hypothetical protein QM724_07655 [Flavobacteriales bacterium]